MPSTLSASDVTKMNPCAEAGFAPQRAVSRTRNRVNGATYGKRERLPELRRKCKGLAIGCNRLKPGMELITRLRDRPDTVLGRGDTAGGVGQMWRQVSQIARKGSMQGRSGKGGIEVKAQAADCTKFNLPRNIETGQDACTVPSDLQVITCKKKLSIIGLGPTNCVAGRGNSINTAQS